jgi:tetratricopeptide (TPR) repeat protein
MALLGAYGRALADAGQYQQALVTLERAHTPDNPDWRILNVQGAVLDQMGRHTEAQRHYASALKIMPNEASVLSNLGSSYMQKDLKNAEATLRRAATECGLEGTQVVVGLLGRFDRREDCKRGPAGKRGGGERRLLRQRCARTGRKWGAPTPDAGSDRIFVTMIRFRCILRPVPP